MNQKLLKELVTAKGNLFTGNIPEINGDPLNFYIRTREKYGDYIKYPLLPKMYLYGLYHPDAVQHVLQKKNYVKPAFFYNATRPFFGNGLFTSEGESWLRQRRLAQPAFHKKNLEFFSKIMNQSIMELIEKWDKLPDNYEINLSEEMMQLTLKILSKSLFSLDISDDANEFGKALRNGFEFVSQRMSNPMSPPLWIPTSTNKLFFQNKKVIDEIVNKIIISRREDKKKYNDLMDMLIEAKDEDSGDFMNDNQLKDEIITILVAGHDTTSAALSWTFYLLSQNNIQKQNLLDELKSVLDNKIPQFIDMEKLPYTKMVLEEAMRLYPPAWGLPRESTEDDQINGYFIKKKTTIALSQYVTHRHPEFWKKPLEFYPEHFEKEEAEKRHKFAYFPFGGGSRMCIGSSFAMLEAQMIIAALLQRFDFKLKENQEIVPDTTFTLMPKNGINMYLEKRHHG